MNYISCSILLPIETLSEKNYIYNTNRDNNEHTDIIKKDFFNEIYTILEIGNPIQKIFLFIRTSNQDFNIISKNVYYENNIINNKYNLSEFYKEYNLFNEKSSKTYSNEGCKEILGLSDDFETICDSFDDFVFNQIQNFDETRITNVNQFFFKLIKETDNNIPGILGLGLFEKSRNPAHNFLKILKNYNLTDNFYFYFDFLNLTKGKLIIGSLPHEINKNKFSENDLFFANVDIDSFELKKWKIKFDEININNDFRLLNKKAEFNFDMNIIIGTKDLEAFLLKAFFNNFIFNKMCFNDTFNYSPNFGYNFYYCKKDLKRTLYDLLPKINFFSKSFNFTFELDKEDLFTIEKNYIYLRIIFPKKKANDVFVLGKYFILKYQFVFNPDLQTIGFYKRNSNVLMDDKKDVFGFNNIIKIFVIIILIIIFVLILKFMKFFDVNKKKKNNKLIEHYDYDNKNVNEKNKNSKNFIEMKIDL